MPETLIIYGAMLLFGGIGVFFLVMWDLYARRYKNKYSLEVSARTVKVLGSRSNSPTIFYEAEMDGRTETFIESSGLGLPSYVPRVGDEVTLRVHPDPERIDSVGIDFKTRPFICVERAPATALFYGIMGMAFLGAAVLGTVMYTINV